MARLTDATHYAGTAVTSDNLKTERGITYDRNGNITGLNRVKDAAWNSEILAFTHTGNRITQWADVSGIESGSYTYDAMGNRLTDSNKSLQFSYNLANLPCRVEGLAGGANAGLTLSYSYLADGTKTSAVANGGGNVDGLRYRGSFVYEVTGSGERLCSIAWDEGRISLDYSPNPANPAVRDEWHVRDHLGSTRAVVNLTDYGTVLEQNEYLPFGTRLNSTQSLATNRYRFGGKEEQRFGSGSGTTDLGLSDFGARYYDPFAARWTTRDPLAWKYYSLSPYIYCCDDPILLLDSDGKKPRIYVETQRFGHAFVSIGSGDNTTVYTYGRYAGLDKDKSSFAYSTPTGEGVLVRLTGDEAKEYILKEVSEKNASVYEFNNIPDDSIAKHFDTKFNSSKKSPSKGKYKDYENARVIDSYNLFDNNCVTTTVSGIQSGSSVDLGLKGIKIPLSLRIGLNYKSNHDNSIKTITKDDIYEEFKH